MWYDSNNIRKKSSETSFSNDGGRGTIPAIQQEMFTASPNHFQMLYIGNIYQAIAELNVSIFHVFM